MKVLVTGATGFLGPHIVEAVERTGWTARAALRAPDRAVPGTEKVLIAASGEIADWRPAVTGVDAVIHLAARAHRPARAQAADEANHRAANVENTLALAREAAAAGVGHFIFLSSIAVNGSNTDGRPPFREDDRPAPETVYARTKLEAEKGLRELASAGGMRLTVLRTPLIYGRGARGNLALLAAALRRGLPLPLAGIANRRAFAAAGNLADFAVHALSGRHEGTFIVADDEQVSTTEFVRLLAGALHVRPRLFTLPKGFTMALPRMLGRAEAAKSLFGSLCVDNSRTRATGWRPKLGMEEALRQSGL